MTRLWECDYNPFASCWKWYFGNKYSETTKAIERKLFVVPVKRGLGDIMLSDENIGLPLKDLTKVKVPKKMQAIDKNSQEMADAYCASDRGNAVVSEPSQIIE